MSVDLSAIKPGDEVTVRGQFRNWAHETGGNAYVEITTNCSGYVHQDAIVSHTPRALQVGDQVQTKLIPEALSRHTGAVLHIHDGYAWVDWPTSMIDPIWPIDQLERIP